MVSKKTAKTGSVVYVGPSIRGVVRQYTTFTGSLPDTLIKKAGEIPAIQCLIIPLADLPYAMNAINGRTGRYYALYRKVQSKI